MNRLIFNENALEELEYRRCTWWSSFLENIAERDDGEVYDVNSLDKEFDDDSSNDDADEAEEVEDLDDIEYHHLMNQSSEQEKTTFIMESEEIQDILNSTRPILKEHELKLKKTGLENVMNTFDSVRIEKEVGGWMRRQHSAHIAKTKVQSTDTDSSLSCEDDRYIRSVQKCHHMRKPKYKQCFKKCKNYQTSCCTRGMFVEPKPHKLHNCNCCKYQLNSITTPKYWKMSSNEESEIIDKEHAKLTIFSENKNKRHHFTRQDSSSSASDCDFQGRCFSKRDSLTPVRGSQKNSFPIGMVEESLLQKGNRNQLMSMIEKVYETPTKPKSVKSSIPHTAPSKITTKRTAAQKALSLLNTNKIKNAKTIKSKRVDKTQNGNSSSEYNTTFENDIKIAKALSLKSLKQNDDKYNSPKPQPCTSLESTNSNLYNLAGSSRNKEVKESMSTAKTKKKTERKNKTQSKSMKNQTLRKFNEKPDETKENTFLAHSENICNSTAVNTAAARKQLPNRIPAIDENLECSSTATPCIENKQHMPRKKATSHLSPIEESSRSSLERTPKIKTQFKTAKELIILSPSVEEHVTPTKATSKIGVRHAVTEPRRKQRRLTKNNKTMDYRSNISNTTLESAVKANRIMLYTPQRKAPSMDGDFQVTKELMSSVVGEKHARRFFKYHIGRLTFPKTSTIYYCPPETELSSSESDEDPLQKAGRCGELHESEQQDDSTTL